MPKVCHSPSLRPLRATLICLGCPKNEIDAEIVLGELAEAGWEISFDPTETDLLLVNTCGFIASAREESFASLEEAVARRQASGRPKVVAMGCMAERYPELLWKEIPELDAVWGFAAYGRIPILAKALLECHSSPSSASPSKRKRKGDAPATFLQREEGGSNRSVRPPPSAHPIPEGPRLLLTGGAYAYLRIAEGCDNRCAYCTIPSIRGLLRSRPIDSILAEARTLVGMGVQELILVAQDTTAYGFDLPGGPRLADLLKRLLEETGDVWIRILYAHPAHLDDNVIEMVTQNPRLCGYLDLPIQHLQDRLLAKMRRGYTRAILEERIQSLRQRSREIVLRSTVIVGYPGETEEDFQELLAFIRQGYFQHLGAFIYSREEGTEAASDPDQVPLDIAEARYQAIMEAQQEVSFAWLEGRVGRIEEILLEGPVRDASAKRFPIVRNRRGLLWKGRSRAEAPEVDGTIFVIAPEGAPGRRIRACLAARRGYDMEAYPVASDVACDRVRKKNKRP